jgi:hypothetical protein
MRLVRVCVNKKKKPAVVDFCELVHSARSVKIQVIKSLTPCFPNLIVYD